MIAFFKTPTLLLYSCVLTVLVNIHATPCLFIDDKILSLIYDEEDTIVITQKDVMRKNILGRAHSLDDLKKEALICRDARNLKIILPDDATERMIEQIQKQNNISSAQFSSLLAAEGHTLDSYRQELKNVQVINTMLDFKVHARATVSYDTIMDYYTSHPVTKEPAYHMISCFVPFDTAFSKKKQKHFLEKQISKEHNLPWTQPFWIQDSAIADTKDFIRTMNIDSSKIEEELDGFRIYKLLAKQESILVPLTERYEEIAKILKEPLEKDLLDSYYKELFNNAIIVDF